jgi:hypothetical protein
MIGAGEWVQGGAIASQEKDKPATPRMATPAATTPPATTPPAAKAGPQGDSKPTMPRAAKTGEQNERKPAARRAARSTASAHTAPKPQPTVAPAASVPTGDLQLGVVRLPKAVTADGKPLPPGTYEVRVTAQPAAPAAPGETPSAERWAEFVQKGQIMGREVVTIVSKDEASVVQKDTPPRPNVAKVDTLKGGDYVRVWFNKDGNYYLLHLPPAA